MPGLHTLSRKFCYVVLWLFSATTLGLTAVRLHYTLHLPRYDTLNDGVDFYDPIIAEILATAGLTILFAPVLIVRIHKHHEDRLLSTFGHELIGLLSLFALWIVGAIIATTKWGNLDWCHKDSSCRLLTAILAFTWMSWIMTFFLTTTCLGYIVRNKGFSHPTHGQSYSEV